MDNMREKSSRPDRSRVGDSAQGNAWQELT
jgi:hypothetical protein